MAVFQTLVPVFNRAPVPLSIRFDGQEKTIEPGEVYIPDITVMYAKNQNPIMGSQDVNNPHVSGARYLIVEKGEDGYGEPLTPLEWDFHLGCPSRYNEQAAFEEKYANAPKARLVLRGKGRQSTATSRYDAGGMEGVRSAFSNK